MFLEYYGLREQPFGVTPDPRFLYFGATHREALASLFYGIESGCGFLALIAPPGMGKTTLLFHLLEKLRGSAQTVFLFQTQCGSREMFRHLLNDLGIDSIDQDLATMHESLNSVLLNNARKGRRVVLVIDEAQNLKESVLETVRLLSDFETPQAKLLQIVLSGQPQLADKLSHPNLTQLRQRISVFSRLHPFTRVETMVYIEYRLSKAGYSGPPVFSYGAADLIAAASKGVPRTINNLCFSALTLGFAKRQKQIDAATVCEVMADLELEGLSTHQSAAPDATEDSLSSFDGISPSSDLTYQDFHDAVRAAWGNGAPSKGENRPAQDVPRRTPPNSTQRPVDAVFRMSLQTEGTATTAIELDHIQEQEEDQEERKADDGGGSSGSLPISESSRIALADRVAPQARRDESQVEQRPTATTAANGTGSVAQSSAPVQRAAQNRANNSAYAASQQPAAPVAASSQAPEDLHSKKNVQRDSFLALSRAMANIIGRGCRNVLLAIVGAVFRTWQSMFKRRTVNARRGRAVRGGTVVAVVFSMTASGLVFGSRHREFFQPPVKLGPVAEICLVSPSSHADSKTPFSGEMPGRAEGQQ
jgi:type II secretory pathway predicted ATPase ExeA